MLPNHRPPFPIPNPRASKIKTEKRISNNIKQIAPRLYINSCLQNKVRCGYTVDGVSSFLSVRCGVDGSRCIRIDDFRDWGGGLQ